MKALRISLVVAVLLFAASAYGHGGSRVSFGIGFGFAPPAVYQPVYAYPQPVYAYPQPVYAYPQPVYVAPQPAYVYPAPVCVQPSIGIGFFWSNGRWCHR